MTEDEKIGCAASVILIGFLVLCVAALWLLEIPFCNARTADIGYPHRWKPFGGCQIEVEDGLWIPLKNYRFFGDNAS